MGVSACVASSNFIATIDIFTWGHQASVLLSMSWWLFLVENFQVFEVIPFGLLSLSRRSLPFNLNGGVFVFLHLIGYTRLFRRLWWLRHGELLDVGLSIRCLCRWRFVCSKFPKIEILDYVGCNSQIRICTSDERCIRCLVAAATTNDLRMVGVAFRARRANKELCNVKGQRLGPSGKELFSYAH
jgi:hypothetical protein